MVSPQTWHYGLVARWWAECNGPEPDELAFYRSWVAAGDGQRALDLGCGTGRLLLPLVRDGLEVHGCDISADMLAHCREQVLLLLAAAGFGDVTVQTGYAGSPATADDTMLVFVARR